MTFKKLMTINLILFLLIAKFAYASAVYRFEIINDKKRKSDVRRVEVRLDRRITEKQLENLAFQIKKLDNNYYEKIHILCFLPYQSLDAGAWAIMNFSPNLEVNILGATVEKIKELENLSILNGWQAPESPSSPPRVWGAPPPNNLQYGGYIIGEWISESCKITIFKKDENYYINFNYGRNIQTTKELKGVKDNKGQKFIVAEDTPLGDYFIINKSGSIEFWNVDGHFGNTLPSVN
jgi:hypothetical protein